MRLSGTEKLRLVQFITLAHNVITRVLTFAEENAKHVTVCQFVSSVPFVNVILEELLFNASCSVHHQPTQSNVIVLHVATVFVVTVLPVLVALNVIAPVYVLVIPLTSERLPYIFKAVDPAHVGAPTSGFPHVISAQKASLSIVTV